MTAISQKRSRRDRAASRRASMKELLLTLANLRDDGLAYFHKKWKQIYELYRDEDVLARRDELRLLWAYGPYEATHVIHYDPSHRRIGPQPHPVELPLTERNRKLYEDWYEHREWIADTFEKCICDHWLSMKGVRFEVLWGDTGKAIVPRGRRLPANLVLACLRLADSFGFCRNPGCPAPYFFFSRRDQLYCSTTCAWPAKKAAKLKWWHEHRTKSAARTKPRRTRRRR